MKNYYNPAPKQLTHYLARRTWNSKSSLPASLEQIKQALINRKEIK